MSLTTPNCNIHLHLFNLQLSATNVGIIILVGLVNLWLILPLFFLAIITYKFRHFYLETARDVKRLEATSIDCFILLFLIFMVHFLT